VSHDPRTEDLGFARVDLDRAARTGDGEVVYGAGKTPEQIVSILTTLHRHHPDRAVLATRLSAEAMHAVEAVGAHVDRVARAATLGPLPTARGTVAVVSAGTSDAPVAAEAVLTARVHGAEVDAITDVGVAGLHRLLGVRDRLEVADCLVVVAGMEASLAAMVGAMADVPVVAVPTSTGAPNAFAGLGALMTMLNSATPGVAVSNIDNGYSAGVFAARVARRASRS
jgi:NCAIR mutase (PurE)-related protein